METPSSVRKSATSAAGKVFPVSVSRAEKGMSRMSGAGKVERTALLDITNDSPIVGLAMASLDSPGTAAKKFGRVRQTPGSGEDLLRGQVKTLLQRIEEEGVVEVGRDLVPDRLPSSLFLGLTDSPALRFLAPTPANTPLTVDVAVVVLKKDAPEIILVLPAIQPKQGMVIADPESPLTRALLFDDSPGKSNMSDSSARYSEITCEGSFKSTDEDGSSVWSTQANASSNNDEDEDGNETGEGEEEAIQDEYEEEEDIYGIEDLCNGLSSVCVQEKRLPEFEGRHTRFTYNSDDEIEGEEVPRTG